MFKLFTRFIISLTLASVWALPLLVATPSLAATPSSSPTVDISVAPVQGQSASEKLKSRAAQSWPWYITRGAGIVAVVLLFLLMLSGIGLVTGYTFRFFEPLTAWATHRAIGIAFGVAVLIHVVALLFDTYVPFSIAAILFPFVSNYHPTTYAGIHFGSLFVALGVFALYGLAVVIISSLLWVDKKPRRWKLLHFLSYIVVIFIFFHGLYLGTDLTHGIFRTAWIVFGLTTGIAILYRLKRARSI